MKSSTFRDVMTSSDKSIVHKDFHGFLSFYFQHVYETYGEEEMEECLRHIGRNVYRPLIEALAREGLIALERYWIG